jgi:hypothetical protein
LIAIELKKGKQANQETIDFYISLARRRMTEVRLLFDFMVLFREAYKYARLSEGKSEDCRYEVFNNIYQEFAKKSNFVRGSPYLRIICYLAAMSRLKTARIPKRK